MPRCNGQAKPEIIIHTKAYQKNEQKTRTFTGKTKLFSNYRQPCLKIRDFLTVFVFDYFFKRRQDKTLFHFYNWNKSALGKNCWWQVELSNGCIELLWSPRSWSCRHSNLLPTIFELVGKCSLQQIAFAMEVGISFLAGNSRQDQWLLFVMCHLDSLDKYLLQLAWQEKEEKNSCLTIWISFDI